MTTTILNVFAMAAGNEIDALVGKRMGLDVRGEWPCYSCEGCESIDRDSAWEGTGHDSVRPVFLHPHGRTETFEADEVPILGCHPTWLFPVPRYSTDIAEAWKIVDSLQKEGRYIELSTAYEGERVWTCIIGRKRADDPDGESPTVGPPSDTAMLAVCRALLMAQ